MTPKILAQSKPTGTSAGQIYSPATGLTAIVKELVVCNQSSSSAVYSIFLDNGGTTYDDSSALFDEIDIPAHSTDRIRNCYWTMTSSDNLAVKSGTGSAITYTVFGQEHP